MNTSLTWARLWPRAAVCGLVLASMSCTDLTGNAEDKLPSGVPDPTSFDNPSGALAFYHAALCTFQDCTGEIGTVTQRAFESATLLGGLFGDELQSSQVGGSVLQYQFGDVAEIPADARLSSVDGAPIIGTSPYGGLHLARRAARQATGALRAYGMGMSPALRGHMLALEGYAEILLADLYCSGVPLSTVDYKQDYTYQAGSTTQEVYAHAITLLDSAIAVSADSNRVLNFARVAKARALLDLGQYAEAARIAAEVPSGFVYQFEARWGVTDGSDNTFRVSHVTVSDREGGMGMPYRSSRDPRTAVVPFGTNAFTGDTLWFPAKYDAPTGTHAITMADAVEARLIQAEGALYAHDVSAWLAVLNALRTDGSMTVSPNAADPAQLDTIWTAGTGGVAGLAPLRDPGANLSGQVATDARVDMLFAERAAWLFLTGHRQGDLRRLVRAPSLGGYGRSQARTYPTGPYAAPGLVSTYGTAVNLMIPDTERRNKKFTGCLDRRA